MIADHFIDKWSQPPYQPSQPFVWPSTIPIPPVTNPLTQAEIDELRKLLERAREYDKKNNEPNCELDEKKERLKKLAKDLGYDIAFL